VLRGNRPCGSTHFRNETTSLLYMFSVTPKSSNLDPGAESFSVGRQTFITQERIGHEACITLPHSSRSNFGSVKFPFIKIYSFLCNQSGLLWQVSVTNGMRLEAKGENVDGKLSIRDGD
jgi:hypothetical protein